MREERSPEEIQNSIDAAKRATAKTKIANEKKAIKSGRNALLVLGILQIILALYYYYGPYNLVESLYIDGGLGLFFIALYFYAATNPRISFIVAISLYLMTIIFVAFVDPTTLYKGIILKAAIIYYLYTGIKATKNYVQQQTDENILDQSYSDTFEEIR